MLPILLSHRLLSVHKMAKMGLMLLLQMLHVAWSVCLSVGHVDVPCKNSCTDRDAVWAFEVLTHVGPRNQVLDGVKIG